MPGLLDIATSARTVSVQGVDVSVTGVSAEGLVYLLTKFPELTGALAGEGNLTPAALLESAPLAVKAIIAAGTGSVGDARAESVAACLPLGTQVALLEAILEATMPDGLDPFIEGLSKLAGVLEGAPASKLKKRGLKLPPQSKS